MWNNLIAVLLTFGFYKRATTEIEEKTDNASWWRVFIYLVLTALVVAFYVKSYTVASIINVVNIEAYKGSLRNGQCTDTIESLELYTALNPDSYNYGYTLGRELSDSRQLGKSCVGLNIIFGHDSVGNTPYYTSSMDLMGYGTSRGFYCFNHGGSRIPSFSPFAKAPDYEDTPWRGSGKPDSTYNFTMWERFYANKADTLLLTPTKKPISGVTARQYLLRSDKNTAYGTHIEFGTSLINSFNFLSAADLSQCIVITTLKTNIPIKQLSMGFDTPIEVTSFPGSYESTMTGIFTRDPELLQTSSENDANGGTFMYHVKFPTMANLQLVRSLILTTILTAVVALLFSNLYYCARRFVMRRKDTKNDKAPRSIEDKRIRRYRRVVRIISAVFYSLILAYAVMIFTDTRIETAVPIWLCWAIVAAIGAVLLAAAVYARKKLIR